MDVLVHLQVHTVIKSLLQQQKCKGKTESCLQMVSFAASQRTKNDIAQFITCAEKKTSSFKKNNWLQCEWNDAKSLGNCGSYPTSSRSFLTAHAFELGRWFNS